jgi:hypothetical protein
VFAGIEAPDTASSSAPSCDVAMALLTLSIAMLPQALGLDRERGILRRLSTAPAHPRVLVAAIAAALVGAIAFHLPLPSQRHGSR